MHGDGEANKIVDTANHKVIQALSAEARTGQRRPFHIEVAIAGWHRLHHPAAQFLTAFSPVQVVRLVT
jgi:hypothetical protein